MGNIETAKDLGQGIYTKTEVDNSKANVNGDINEIFKVANAVNDDEALSKGQLDGQVTNGTFTATLYGKTGNTQTGTEVTKDVTGEWHKVMNRVFITINYETNGNSHLISGNIHAEFSLHEVRGLPFTASSVSQNTIFYGRGLQFRYSTATRTSFFTSGLIKSGENIIYCSAESKNEAYSGYITLKDNSSGTYLKSITINYQV